jgi:hypothetical protein
LISEAPLKPWQELWDKSAARYDERRQRELAEAWAEYHQGQAARLRANLEALAASHEAAAERYRGEGAA